MYTAAIFLPLLGALIAGLFGRVIGHRWSEVVSVSLMFVAAALSCVIFAIVAFGDKPQSFDIVLFRWIESGEFRAVWALRYDTLSAVMVFTVNFVSALIHLYSIGYMHNDPGRARFFAYLSLFTFSMLMLVSANNLVQLFFGWEGVGLCSYLLIGFWYKKPELRQRCRASRLSS